MEQTKNDVLKSVEQAADEEANALLTHFPAKKVCQRIGGCLHDVGMAACCCDDSSCDCQDRPPNIPTGRRYDSVEELMVGEGMPAPVIKRFKELIRAEETANGKPPYPGWRPYCLVCPTMSRMVARDYGWQCVGCSNKIKHDLTHYDEPVVSEEKPKPMFAGNTKALVDMIQKLNKRVADQVILIDAAEKVLIEYDLGYTTPRAIALKEVLNRIAELRKETT